MWSLFPSRAASRRQSTPSSPDPAAVLKSLHDLERLWKRIQARIHSSEGGEAVEDESEREYLNELREIAMDAEDVLDEWDYELMRAEVEGGDGAAAKRKRGEAFDLLADDPPVRDRMARQIEQIMGRFAQARRDNDALSLGKGDGRRRRLGRGSNPPPSSSLVDERYVFDRDEYKHILVHYMLSEECDAGGLTVIPIVGMGLSGKTTLAQLIYNDHRFDGHFDLRGWVSVTKDSDLMGLLRGVIESLTRQSCHCSQLDTIQGILQQRIVGRKFLLVLDDVCRESMHFWYQFKDSVSSGSQGSVLLITTKVGEVAERMKTVPECFFLFQNISNDSCWLLFKKYAFDGQDAVQGLDMARLHEKVLEICNGMPSVAKLLGAYFRKQFHIEEWMDFMESVVEDEIVPALQSSYQALPAYLKPCLRYCSLFPKDYLFTKDELVRLWMAQGLIQQKNREQPEAAGIKYFNELLSRSFFLQCEGNIEKYYMPNLICDLVYSISTNEHSRVENICILPQKARHLSLACQSAIPCESFYKYRDLRSFLVLRTFPYTSIVNLEIQDKMFHELNLLRSLDLSYTSIKKIPDSIGCLKHLRMLALNHTDIEGLPESVQQLYNLQILELRQCPRLQELPRGISSLINLRHLDVDSDYLLLHMSFQIHRLTSLQKLPTFNLQKSSDSSRIRELEYLTNLRELGISGLCNVTNVDDANTANLQNKRCLKILKLVWPAKDDVPKPSSEQFINSADETVEEDNVLDLKNARGSVDEQCSCHQKPSSHDVDYMPEMLIDIPDEQESNFSSIHLRAGINNMAIQDPSSSDAAVGEEDLLESLRPSTTLETLHIESYGGTKFPDWIGDSSFCKLEHVELIDCKCVLLPPLGLLPDLRFLSINGMSVDGTGFCRIGPAQAFPRLETLAFHNMNKWEKWGGLREGDFPNLSKLCLFNCPQLRRVPNLFSSLKVLEVERCMKLSDIPNLPKLEVLKIYCCDGLTSIPNLPELEVLEICYCDGLASIPTTLTSLCSLTIMYCQSLKSIPPLQSDVKFYIQHCDLPMSELPEAKIPSSSVTA